MENKRFDLLFIVTLVAFLIVGYIVIQEFESKRKSDYQEYSTTLSKVVKLKNDRIRVLADLLAQKERDNADLKNTLSETRNSLETLSKKLVAPTQAVAPAAAAPAVPSK